MLNPSVEDWQSWGILDEFHKFFCLHWTELFDPETPDTWQVRSCNIKTILQELVDTAPVAIRIESYRKVMRAILDEGFAILKRDEVLPRFYPFVVPYLEPWRNKSGHEKKAIERESI